MNQARGSATRGTSRGARTCLAVVGGAGAMGRITVRDLVETAPADCDILIADYNEAAARQLARQYQGRVRAVRVDVNDVRATAEALRGVFAVVNACQHDFNLKVMEACLRAGAHYCDLGGLFHVARKQLALDAKFKKAGLTAILGIGAAPGLVNVLARSAADTMERVDEIHIAVGGIDRTPGRGQTILGTSYSLMTVLDEASLPAALFTGGKLTFVAPMSGNEPVRFPAPVGLRRPARTIHSEVATLPLSYKKKGIKEVSFRIAFPEELDEKLRFLHALGMLSAEPVEVGRAKVAPRDLLLKLAARLPTPAAGGTPDEYEVLRVIVRGERGGKRVEDVLDCHCAGMPEWKLGIDVDTGCPPSIAVQLLRRGEITVRGVVPPERSIPAEPFFAELKKRGMRIRRGTGSPA